MQCARANVTLKGTLLYKTFRAAILMRELKKKFSLFKTEGKLRLLSRVF